MVDYHYTGQDLSARPQNVSQFTSISFDSNVTSIGDYAFTQFRNVRSVIIPSTITSIGDGAFFDCARLQSCVIPNSVNSIGASAFKNCKFTSFIIPSNVTTIGASAFTDCFSLVKITYLGTSNGAIDDTAFTQTSTDEINVPLNWSGNATLGGLPVLTGNFNYIGVAVDSGNAANYTSVSFDPTVTSIVANAFSGCSSLTNITIPAEVTTIGSSIFSNCSKLTAIRYLGNTGATTIDSLAFTGAGTYSVKVNVSWTGGTTLGGLRVVQDLPSAPTKITSMVIISPEGISYVGISWFDDYSVGRTYSVYRDNIFVGSTSLLSYQMETVLPGRYTFYVTSTYNGKTSGKSSTISASVSSATALKTTVTSLPTASPALHRTTKFSVILTGGTASAPGNSNVAGYFACDNTSDILDTRSTSNIHSVVFYPTDLNSYSPSDPVSVPVTVNTVSSVINTLTSSSSTDAEKAMAATNLITSYRDSYKRALIAAAGGTTISLNTGQSKFVLATSPYLSIDADTTKSVTVVVPNNSNSLTIPSSSGYVYFPFVSSTTYYVTYSGDSRQILYEGNDKIYIGPIITSNPNTVLDTTTATEYLVGDTISWNSTTTFVLPALGGMIIGNQFDISVTPPTNITASVSSGNITVSWNSTNPSGATYSLYNGTISVQLTNNKNKSHTINGAGYGNYTFYVTATYNGKTSVRCGPAIVSVSPTTAAATAIITNPTVSSGFGGSTLSTLVLTGGAARAVGATGAPTVPGFFAFLYPLQSITVSGNYPVVFYPSNATLYSRSGPAYILITVTTQPEVVTALAGTAVAKAAAVTSLVTGFSDANKQILADNLAGATVSLTAEQAKSLLAAIPFLSSVTTVASLSVIVPNAAKAVEIPPMANGSFVYLPLITNTTYYATYSNVTRQILYDSGTFYVGPIPNPGGDLVKSTAQQYSVDANMTWVPANFPQRAINLKLPGLGGAYFGPDGEIVPCFPTGTRVLTAAGYKAVESLQKTDRIVTPDGRSLPFKLYSTVIEKTTEATAPYHIPKGTIGNKGAITLSPQHAIQSAKGVWQIPRNAAKRFSAIRQVNLGERVEYFHLELPNFFTDNIVAEGNIVESFGANQARGIDSIYTYSAALKGCTRIAQRPVTKSLTL